MIRKTRKQGRSASETNGMRTTAVANRTPRLQVKINGNPKGQDSDKYKK
jgi:hypothetical protein